MTLARILGQVWMRALEIKGIQGCALAKGFKVICEYFTLNSLNSQNSSWVFKYLFYLMVCQLINNLDKLKKKSYSNNFVFSHQYLEH